MKYRNCGRRSDSTIQIGEATSLRMRHDAHRAHTDIGIGRLACGGKLKMIAVIEEPAVIEKILRHLGLKSTAAATG